MECFTLQRAAVAGLLIASAATLVQAQAQETPPDSLAVTADNFPRAESDMMLASMIKDGGFGKFVHNRALTPIEHQPVIRQNRDTLYSFAIFDLDAAPVTITLPDAGKRFMSVQIITEDQYTPQVIYRAGKYTFTRKEIGTRYVAAAVRILVNPNDPNDMDSVHRLQDALKVEQADVGKFEIPHWDQASQKKVRDALLVLGATLPDSNGMFGAKGEVNPVRYLIGSATAWGGNPQKDAIYLNVTPAKNDGSTIYRMRVKDVPVDAFWSISVYNARGYFEKNDLNAYTLNSITARRAADSAADVQFGGCDGKISNCLPITPGWNYMVRLYRPQAAILDGHWTFPEAVPAN